MRHPVEFVHLTALPLLYPLSLSPLSLLRAREQGQVGEVREEVLMNHLNEVPSALKGDMVEDFHT